MTHTTYSHMNIYIRKYALKSTNTQAQTHIDTYKYTHIYTQTQTHIYTQTLIPLKMKSLF